MKVLYRIIVKRGTKNIATIEGVEGGVDAASLTIGEVVDGVKQTEALLGKLTGLTFHVESRSAEVRDHEINSRTDGPEAHAREQSLARAATISREYDRAHTDTLLREDREAVRLPAYWRSSDGRVIQIKDMDDGHLRNTVSFLARRLATGLGAAPWLGPFQSMTLHLATLLAECERRGFRV
jgi:hypothetical protein